MPRLPVRFAVLLILVLATAACAPAKRTAPSAAAAKTTGQTASASPARAAPPAPAVSRPLSVVMGAPLPGAPKTPSPVAPASPGVAAVPPAAAGAAPAASQPAPSALGDASGTPGAPPTGFAGLAWGVSATSNPGLAAYEVDQAASVTTCLWPRGPRDIAGAPIREAFYEFYKDKFYHVWLEFDGMAAYKAALAGLTRTYGPPTQENLEKYYHAWNLGDVNIYCAYHAGENGGDVSFFYQPLYEQMMAARKAGPAKSPSGKAKP